MKDSRKNLNKKIRLDKIAPLYKVLSYDVTGNNKEGYDVDNVYDALIGNSVFNCHSVQFRLKKYCSNKDIIKALKKSEWLKKSLHFSSFIVEGEQDYYISYNTAKVCSRPICELRQITG